MPCRRDHHAAARSNGRLTTQSATATRTAVTIPALIGPRRSDRVSRGARLTKTASTARLASVAMIHSSSKNRSKRTPARTASAPNTRRASSDGGARSAGTFVLHRTVAATAQTTSPTTAKVAGRPMRIAVISDVHGNYHALEAVLEEI